MVVTGVLHGAAAAVTLVALLATLRMMVVPLLLVPLRRARVRPAVAVRGTRCRARALLVVRARDVLRVLHDQLQKCLGVLG